MMMSKAENVNLYAAFYRWRKTNGIVHADSKIPVASQPHTPQQSSIIQISKCYADQPFKQLKSWMFYDKNVPGVDEYMAAITNSYFSKDAKTEDIDMTETVTQEFVDLDMAEPETQELETTKYKDKDIPAAAELKTARAQETCAQPNPKTPRTQDTIATAEPKIPRVQDTIATAEPKIPRAQDTIAATETKTIRAQDTIEVVEHKTSRAQDQDATSPKIKILDELKITKAQQQFPRPPKVIIDMTEPQETTVATEGLETGPKEFGVAVDRYGVDIVLVDVDPKKVNEPSRREKQKKPKTVYVHESPVAINSKAHKKSTHTEGGVIVLYNDPPDERSIEDVGYMLINGLHIELLKAMTPGVSLLETPISIWEKIDLLRWLCRIDPSRAYTRTNPKLLNIAALHRYDLGAQIEFLCEFACPVVFVDTQKTMKRKAGSMQSRSFWLPYSVLAKCPQYIEMLLKKYGLNVNMDFGRFLQLIPTESNETYPSDDEVREYARYVPEPDSYTPSVYQYWTLVQITSADNLNKGLRIINPTHHRRTGVRLPIVDDRPDFINPIENPYGRSLLQQRQIAEIKDIQGLADFIAYHKSQTPGFNLVVVSDGSDKHGYGFFDIEYGVYACRKDYDLSKKFRKAPIMNMVANLYPNEQGSKLDESTLAAAKRSADAVYAEYLKFVADAVYGGLSCTGSLETVLSILTEKMAVPVKHFTLDLFCRDGATQVAGTCLKFVCCRGAADDLDRLKRTKEHTVFDCGVEAIYENIVNGRGSLTSCDVCGGRMFPNIRDASYELTDTCIGQIKNQVQSASIILVVGSTQLVQRKWICDLLNTNQWNTVLLTTAPPSTVSSIPKHIAAAAGIVSSGLDRSHAPTLYSKTRRLEDLLVDFSNALSLQESSSHV